MNAFRRIIRDEQGLTSVEYAVAGSLITVALVAAFTVLAGSVEGSIQFLAGLLP